MLTLLLFPVPSFVGLYFYKGIDPIRLLQFENISVFKIGLGLQLGFVYGILALLLLQAPVFDKLPVRIESMVRNMKLNWIDCLLLSLCAGIGEELLFRSGVQYFLGPIITSVLFVAIHGYLNPMNWRMSLYGLIVLPFIFLISYGFETFGLWFAIAAHAMYDFVLFISISKDSTHSDR